jgi:hypothetical protein
MLQLEDLEDLDGKENQMVKSYLPPNSKKLKKKKQFDLPGGPLKELNKEFSPKKRGWTAPERY